MSDTSNRRRGLPLQMKMRHDTHFVEDLSVRSAEPVGRMMPLSSIEPDPHQPRTTMGDLEELTASVRDKGILEPILVRPNPDADPDSGGGRRYRIISGERRFHAATEAGLFEIPVIEMEVGEEEALEIALVENLQRKDLTPFEEAEGYQALGSRHGYTHEEIASALGRSRPVITEALALLQMPPRARDAAHALGLTSKSLLLEVIKKAGDESDMIRLLEETAEHGLTRDDLRARPAPKGTGAAGKRAKPYTFRFRAPDKSYNLAVTFRKSTVQRQDLISALEGILSDLRAAGDE